VALGFGHQFLGAAVAVPRGGGVANQVAVVHLEEHRLQGCVPLASLRGFGEGWRARDMHLLEQSDLKD